MTEAWWMGEEGAGGGGVRKGDYMQRKRVEPQW